MFGNSTADKSVDIYRYNDETYLPFKYLVVDYTMVWSKKSILASLVRPFMNLRKTSQVRVARIDLFRREGWSAQPLCDDRIGS